MAQAETTVKVSIRLLPLADAPHSILHALASKRNVVCTRTIYLPPPYDKSVFNTDMWLSQKHCFNGRCYTVPCKSHRGHTFHFYLYRVSELNTQVLVHIMYALVHADPRYAIVYGATGINTFPPPPVITHFTCIWTNTGCLMMSDW